MNIVISRNRIFESKTGLKPKSNPVSDIHIKDPVSM